MFDFAFDTSLATWFVYGSAAKILKQSPCHLSTTQARHCTNESFDQLLGKIHVSLLLTGQTTVMEDRFSVEQAASHPLL